MRKGFETQPDTWGWFMMPPRRLIGRLSRKPAFVAIQAVVNILPASLYSTGALSHKDEDGGVKGESCDSDG